MLPPRSFAARNSLPPEGASVRPEVSKDALAAWPFDRLRTGQGQIRGPCLKRSSFQI